MSFCYLVLLLALVAPSFVQSEVFVENNGDWFKVKTKLKDVGGILEKFDTNVHQFTGASGMFELFLSAYTKDDNSKEKIEYKVRFYDIVEFVESPNGSPGYEPGTDQVIQTYRVTSWGAFTNDAADEEGFIHFECTTLDGVLSFVGHVNGQLASLVIGNSSFELAPNEIKFDLVVDFVSNYQSEGSKLALRARVRTGKKIADNSGGEFTHVNIEGDSGSSGIFSWVPEVVNGGGESVNVIASPPREVSNSDESEKELYFTFDTTAQTVFSWDPKVSVSTGSTVVATFAIVFLAVMAFFTM